MSSRRPRIAFRVLRALALVAPALWLGWWLWGRPRPAPTPFEVALDRALEPILTSRDLGAKLHAATSGQVRLMAREAAQTSIPYLAPRDLELWQDIRLRVARSSSAACARLWQGGATEFFGPAVAALGDDTLREYTEMLGRGLSLKLERKPPPEPSPGALARGLSAIGSALPALERARFEQDLPRRDLPDVRACELFVAVSTGAQQLEPAARTDFLRALAKGLLAER